MTFSGGDYVAAAMFVLVLLREARAFVSKASEKVAAETTRAAIVKAVGDKIDIALAAIDVLEGKRNEHELKCAVIQERAANTMSSVVSRLEKNERGLEQAQGQIRHLATGSANKLMEM